LVGVTDRSGELAALARAARRGDRSALEAFLAQVEPIVVRAVRLIVGSGSAAAEDAAQEALLDIARAITRLEDPERSVAWAMRIATRRALRASRRPRWSSRRAGDEELERAISPAPAPGRLLEIRDAFAALPPRQRAIAVLRIHVGLSEAETAAALGCSIGTVKSTLHAARRRLQEQLRDEPDGLAVAEGSA
jgi:RNA polymerase sigma factor (sigma-70 family)